MALARLIVLKMAYRVVLPLFGQRLQYLGEAGPTKGVVGRKVGTAVDRLQPGGEEYAERPTPTPRCRLHKISSQ